MIMERKTYEERVRDMKNEILEEIRNILARGEEHKFSDTFYIHYVEGEVATTEVCNSVMVENEGTIIFGVENDNPDCNKIGDDSVYWIDIDSLIDALDRLKKENRERKLATIKEIVKQYGNLSLSKGFHNDILGNVTISSVTFNENGDLGFNIGSTRYGADIIPDCELNRIVGYCKEATSPEKLLALTEEQKTIVKRIKEDIKSFFRTGGEIFFDNDCGTLFAVNADGLEILSSYHKDGMMADIDKLPQEDVIGDAWLCYNSEGIKFRKV